MELDLEDQRRRFVILSLLQVEGLEAAAYARRFASDAMADLPELSRLVERGLAEQSAGQPRLTPRGQRRSTRTRSPSCREGLS